MGNIQHCALCRFVSKHTLKIHCLNTKKFIKSNNKISGPLLLFLDQALSSHEMLEVQGFQAGTHAGGL